jgi:hypothetical protein
MYTLTTPIYLSYSIYDMTPLSVRIYSTGRVTSCILPHLIPLYTITNTLIPLYTTPTLYTYTLHTQWTYIFHWASDERLLFESDAMQIKLDQVAAGTVVLTNKCLYFHARKYMDGMSAAHRPFTDRRWHLDRIVEAYGRRYLLQHCAIGNLLSFIMPYYIIGF